MEAHEARALMDLAGSADSSDSPDRLLHTFALHDAIEAGNLEQLKELLQLAKGEQTGVANAGIAALTLETEPVFDIDEVDDDECSPLHLAILKGQYEAVAILIAFKANLKLACEGSPPLHLAVCSAAHKHREEAAQSIIKLLLSCDVAVVQRDDNGRTAFHWAAWLGVTGMLELLASAFQAQAARDAENVLKATLEAGVQLGPPPELPNLHTLQDKQGNTALHLAALSHRSGVVERLLQMPGAKEAGSVLNKSHQTPLHLASASGPPTTVAALMHAYPEAKGIEDRLGQTPMQIASVHRNVASEIVLREAIGGTGALPVRPPARHTLLSAPPACRQHRTAPEPIVRGADLPPENVKRLHVLVDPEDGILRTEEFDSLEWDEEDHFAPLADILRVHEWTYVRKIQRLCHSLPDEPSSIGHLDPDTALCRGTWQAALAGVGSCCTAIDRIMAGKVQNAFCVIRPPGHHAGPLGTVTSALDPHGSQGFCFLNNIAIAGAYAVNTYRHQGIRRIALLDFDVHHGNGTQACVGRVVPQVIQYPVSNPFCEGGLRFQSFHPWFDENDNENILFASVQGFGKKPTFDGSYVYPASGATCDTDLEAAAENGPSQSGPEMATYGVSLFGEIPPEDPDEEFRTVPGQHPPAAGPRIINVGIPGPGSEISLWRRAWRDKILPAVADFKPDFIIISAGFDAHKKDELNYRFIGVTERDYYWLTQQLVTLANTVCQGRIVSALEGGYRIQGRIVSAFSRSVAAHVRALSEHNNQVWSLEQSRRERAIELQRRRELVAAKKANALKAAERAAERKGDLVAAILAAQQETRAFHGASSAAEIGAPEVSAALASIADVSAILNQSVPAGAALPHATSLQDTAALASPDLGGDRRKRRRGAVDYAALNLKLEEEQKRKQGSEGPLSGGALHTQLTPSAALPPQVQEAITDGIVPVIDSQARI